MSPTEFRTQFPILRVAESSTSLRPLWRLDQRFCFPLFTDFVPLFGAVLRPGRLHFSLIPRVCFAVEICQSVGDFKLGYESSRQRYIKLCSKIMRHNVGAFR